MIERTLCVLEALEPDVNIETVKRACRSGYQRRMRVGIGGWDYASREYSTKFVMLDKQ